MKSTLLHNLGLNRVLTALLLPVLLLCGLSTNAQVTTSSITGSVTDQKGDNLVGATVIAVHVPSGTRYGTVTNVNGRYTIPAVRVGGPFTVTVSYTGYETQTKENVSTVLGVGSDVDVTLAEAGKTLGEVTITATRNDIISDTRTGASSTFSRAVVNALPNIGSRSIDGITKYNANGNGQSFGGQDSRLNNFTIDGSAFNNGFGLGSSAQAGGRTNSTAISLDAIEEVQVNVAPFDIRQTGFVGSGINAITRSGTNELSGSAYVSYHDNSKTFNGTKTNDAPVTIGKFNEYVAGLRLGGAIIKNKLFFFVNGEMVRKTYPGTPTAYVPSGASGGTPTRVLAKDLDDVSSLLKSKYGYETGPYSNYDYKITSDKFLARLDYNLNDKNKFTVRYTFHNSVSDQPISNSNSAGAGSRQGNLSSMTYQNSGYLIGDNTRSIVGEWNSTISDKLANNFIVGYDHQNEDRQYKGTLFPTIDILGPDKKTYISAGFDPFTPQNLLNYGTFHATENLSIYQGAHTITVGGNYEYYKSNNNFFPAANGVYVFNSLDDFKAAVNSTADTSPVKINTFQYRYSALKDGAQPLQVLKVNKFDLYAQDEVRFSKTFKLSYGIRAGIISFVQTGLDNKTVNGLSYIDDKGNRDYTIKTSQLPKPSVLWEPRLGFNWDVTGKKQTQLRGGTGIFTGRPPYVWVSNQIGNNGVLTGFIQGTNTTKYKFTNDPSIYTPVNPTLPATFDIAVTDPSYRFPQVWKTDLAIDQKLPFGFVGTLEYIYNKNVNAVKYFDANLAPSTGAQFAGPDNRLRFPGSLGNSTKINANIARAAVMTTTDQGYYSGATIKLEYPNRKGLFGMAAFTISQAADLMSAGSIASGSYTGVRTVNGNNTLSLAKADLDLPNRLVGVIGYRIEYGGKLGGASQISLGYVGENRGFNSTSGIITSRFSYSIAGDMNGDGISNNDLLFVPNSASDLKFKQFTSSYKDAAGATKVDTFTTAMQVAAFDKFISQDDYLKTRKGKYAERNGALFPFISKLDLSFMQEFYISVGGKRNVIQVRADIVNFTNLLNQKWGASKQFITDRPLTFDSVGADGIPVYKLATQTVTSGSVSKQVLLKDTFTTSATINDVWNLQVGIRYIFN
jgi:hypothetical protein